LPLIRQAIGLCPDDLFILTTPWSPPAWMKTNGKFNESGELLPEMWQPFSNYLVKFFQMYEENLGVELWGFTPQNEPLGGFVPTWPFNTCGWTAEDMRDWIATVLGPTVSAAGYRRLKLLIHDFNLNTLSEYITPILEDPNAIEYIDGIAVHWYSDSYMSTDVLDRAHDMADGRFILYTEACIDSVINFVELGNWERGEQYITDIIQDSNHWSTGWIDWNLALDLQGGPNWVSNFVDSSIIVNAGRNPISNWNR
ncbi:putative glucosylceramidase 4, partial [Armadillidium vulgare]